MTDVGPSAAAEPPAARPGPARRAVHLAVLCALAVAQPLLDLYGRNPQFFVARGSERLDIVALTLLLVVGIPAALAALAALAGLVRERVGWLVHLVSVGILSAVAALSFLTRSDLAGPVALAAATVTGMLVTLGYARVDIVRWVLTVLAPAPLVVAGLFLAGSDVTSLLTRRAAGEFVGQPVASRTPVVMVVFDEFALGALLTPDGQIDARRFPNFAALAGSSTWFRNATTVSDYTHLAVPALLTGKRPDRDALPTTADHPENLFTLLAGSYSFDSHEAITALCPAQRCGQPSGGFVRRMRSLVADSAIAYAQVVLPEDYVRTLPSVSEGWGGFGDDAAADAVDVEQHEDAKAAHASDQRRRQQENQPRRLSGFIDGLTATPEPRLSFLHVLLPHVPLSQLPSGLAYPRPPGTPGLTREESGGGGVWAPAEYPTSLTLQRYLLQTKYVDRELGRLVARLRALQVWDRAAVVITADHGVSFTPGTPRRAFSEGNAGEVMPIPLFVKAPGQRTGAVSDRNMESVDVLPTLADLLDVELPWATEGSSGLDTAAPPRPEKRAQSGPGQGLVRPADFRSGAVALATRIARSFPWRDDRWDLFDYGGGDIAARRVDSLPAAPSAGRRVVFRDAQRFAAVSPASGAVPALVAGRVTGPTGLRVAVAVNGVVAAVGRTYEAAGADGLFSLVVPDFVFRPGSNDVRLYVVREDGGRLRLEATA